MSIRMLLLLLLIPFLGIGQTSVVPAVAASDAAGWTSYYQGTMPLVISAPHGGTWNLADVTDRSCEGAVTATDTHTKELAFEISETLSKYYGMRPYVIVCNISRKDIDQNREINEATCGDPSMAAPWHAFHNYIDSALAEAVRKFGACIYIDLHGHGHPIQRLELGYLLNEKKLSAVFSKEETIAVKTTSLGNLLSRESTGDLYNWLFGPEAFGTLMAEKGFPAVPSKQDPLPKEGEKFFNGGYNTKRYTGPDYPNVFGWQIECNYKGVRDPAGRPAFAMAFSDVIVKMIRQFSFIKLPAQP